MSESDDENLTESQREQRRTNDEIRVEIQKLLGAINEDAVKLKNELALVQDLIDDNAPLPASARMANEKLIIAAKQAGIDLENLETMLNPDSSDSESQAENGSQAENAVQAETKNQAEKNKGKKSKGKAKSSKSNVAEVAAAAEELTEKFKRTLKK